LQFANWVANFQAHRNSICNRESRAYEDDAAQTPAQQRAKAGMRLALVLNDALQ
jgi:hypothetical protein